jgi:hypothetical protein
VKLEGLFRFSPSNNSVKSLIKTYVEY